MRTIAVILLFVLFAHSPGGAQFRSILHHNAYFTRAQWEGPDSLMPYAADPGVRRVWAGMDLDKDGRQEIIAADFANGGRVHVFECVLPDSLELVWSSPKLYRVNPNSTPRWVRDGDLDGDGNREIIFPAGPRYTGAIYIFEYNGVDNGFGGPSGAPTLTLTATEFVPVLGPGSALRLDRETGEVSDLDGDGRDELVVANQDNKVYILGLVGDLGGTSSWKIEGGDPAVHPENRFSQGTWWQTLPADIDGDGSKELVNHYWSYYGFWSIDVKGPDAYRFPTPGIDSTAYPPARSQFYHEYLRQSGVDAAAYMGVTPADVDGDGKQELAGIFYSGAFGVEYSVSLVSLSTGDTGVYVWKDDTRIGVIGEGLWMSAGQTTGQLWGIASYDFDGDGRDEIYVGGGEGYTVTQLKYAGTGSILDKDSYTHTIVYAGEDDSPDQIVYSDSLGILSDTARSQHVVTPSLFAGGDANGDGRKELCLSRQSVLESITHIWRHYDTTHLPWGYVIDSTATTPNTHLINIRVLEYQGPVNTDPITLVSPNGGETWSAGSTHGITWNSSGVSTVKIDYSTNGGTTWLPVAGGVAASARAYPWVVPGTLSARCKVRVQDSTTASISDESDNMFSIVRGSWQNALSVSDGCSGAGTLVFGSAAGATDGLDAGLGESDLPPAPPSGIFDARFALPDGAAVFSQKDLRADTITMATWRATFQPGPCGYPIVLSWDSTAFPVTGRVFLRDELGGALIDVNMRSRSSYTLTDNGVTSLSIVYTSELMKVVAVASGWNLLSVPVTTADTSVAALYPGATSSAFIFANGYEAVTALDPGQGCWLKFAEGATVSFVGAQVSVRDIQVPIGWSIIGPFEEDVPVANMTSSPGGIVSSHYFGFSYGYAVASTLQSGKGYWVKASQEGVLHVGAGVAKNAGVNASMDTSWARIIVRDSTGQACTLYLARREGMSGSYELPPPAPRGVFDMRYAEQTLVDTLGRAGHDVMLSSAVAPLQIRAERLQGREFRVTDGWGGRIFTGMLREGETLVAPVALEMLRFEGQGTPAGRAVPTQYALDQNYPNPFNPSTVIRIALPEAVKVRLVVYNILGQQVAELINGELAAGYHDVEFRADHLASGVYLYRLEAGPYTAVKKLVTMK
ncbi:MAG: T9SS type A sorting domain-containing protein [Ignavibacteriae bacterium]|nr:T9SS type A sorting domain-containing protein [Ignavibacteriota bacterium]